MNRSDKSDNSATTGEQVLRDTLAQERAMLASARPVLRHLLSGNGHMLLSEQIVARVNAMLRDLARQLLFALASAADTDTEITDREAFVEQRQAALAGALSADADMLVHLHALATEDLAISAMQSSANYDPVLSPMLQELTGSEDEDVADKAMGVVAAQARYVAQQNRMELPLAELPGDQFHAAMLALAEVAEDRLVALDTAVRGLRAAYDEGETRLGRITNLLMRVDNSGSVLDLEHAGIALFTSAISMACGQDRSRIIMAFNQGQSTHFALCLAAAGLDHDAVKRHFLVVHRDAELPDGFAEIDAEQATALLNSSPSVHTERAG